MRTILRVSLPTLVLVCLFFARSASAQVSNYHPCLGTAPATNEVWIFRDTNYQGPCAGLYIGFYPHGTNLGLGNDQVSSFKVGAYARIRMFLDDTYGRQFLMFAAGNYPSMPPGWNDQISSARVESAFRSTTCNDLQPNEFALFWDANFIGNNTRDCVVLNVATGFWETPDDMGIMNDSVSSIVVGPRNPNLPPNETVLIVLDRDPFNSGSFVTVPQPGSVANLSSLGFNDTTSSVEVITEFQD